MILLNRLNSFFGNDLAERGCLSFMGLFKGGLRPLFPLAFDQRLHAWGIFDQTHVRQPATSRIQICEKIFRRLCLLLLLVISTEGFAGQVSEDFSLILNKESGSLVWNLSQSALHPPLKIKDFVNNAGTATLSVNFDVGSGEHGTFNSTTYSSFSLGGNTSGNIIRLDTSVYNPLQVTGFQLDSGWTLQPVGDNPLIIYSQSDVVIEGSIDCSGGSGDSFQVMSVVASGGQGRCGGGDGGDGSFVEGGITIVAGTGRFLGATVSAGKPSAGQGASSHGTGSGGGGGGSYTSTAAANLAEAGTSQAPGAGGAAGDVGADHQFQFVGGGAGGGGGDLRSASSLSGAGGGAGGGVVIIHAFNDIKVYPTGSVSVSGGDGGGSGSQNSGAGGAGGGGSVKMFAGGGVYVSGPVRAYAGTGGSNSLGTSGGRGAAGRTWLAGRDGYSAPLSPYAINAEKPDTLLAHVGYGRFQTGTFTMSSKTLDSSSTKPTVSSVVLTTSLSAGASASLEISSGENIDFTAVTWTDGNALTEPQSRYFRFRANLTNTDESLGAYINNASILYTPYYQKDFEFNEGGCGHVNANNSQPPKIFRLLALFVIFLIPLSLALKLRRY